MLQHLFIKHNPSSLCISNQILFYCTDPPLAHFNASLISIMVSSLVLIVFLRVSNLLVSCFNLAGSVSMPCMVKLLILRESYSSFNDFTSFSSLRTYDELIWIPSEVTRFSVCPFSISLKLFV